MRSKLVVAGISSSKGFFTFLCGVNYFNKILIKKNKRTTEGILKIYYYCADI